jgi:hypothetical protein
MRHLMRRTVAVLWAVLATAIVGSGCQDRLPVTSKAALPAQAPTTRRTLTDPWAVELLRRCDTLERQYVESERLQRQIQASHEQLMDAARKHLAADTLISAEVSNRQ